jgi:hypothetical protein
LWCDFGPGAAQSAYIVLGSASGSTPATTVFGQQVPLAQDTFFLSMLAQANGATFVGTQGALDANGRARAELVAAPGRFQPLVGRTLGFACVRTGPAGGVSNVDSLVVAP